MLNVAFIKEVGVANYIYRTAIRQFYKRLLRKQHQITLPNGAEFILPINSHFASEVYITRANVDWGSEKLFYSLMKNSGAFLDIGANIGYYSVYMYPKAIKVYSFEPDPRVRIKLQENVAGRENVEIVSLAVGAKRGKTLFTLEGAAELSHLAEGVENGKSQIEVDQITVDYFVKINNLKIESIKIDVEGYDIEVIAGAQNVLSEQRPIVLTEAKATKDLFDLMKNVDYRIFAYVRNHESRAIKFIEILSDVAIKEDTKMLFLVPNARGNEVLMMAENSI